MNKEEIQEDIKKYSSLEAVGKSEGGQIILKDIKQDIVSTIDQLANYKELSHIELIALCAGLSEKLTMMKIMRNAKKNKDMAIEALDED